MKEVYVGIGSNIEPKTYINKVKKELQDYFECIFSDNYKYDPVGFNGPEFINLVVKFRTNLPFKEVEEILSKIEISLGRNEGQRGFSNRVIDLDILLFGSLVIEGKKSLPHKNLDSSLFVLEPLVELAADQIHPISKKTFKEILDNLKN